VYQIAIKDSIGYGMTITLEETPEMLAMKEHTVKQKERTESFRKAEQHGEQAARQAALEKKEADSNAGQKEAEARALDPKVRPGNRLPTC